MGIFYLIKVILQKVNSSFFPPPGHLLHLDCNNLLLFLVSVYNIETKSVQ